MEAEEKELFQKIAQRLKEARENLGIAHRLVKYDTGIDIGRIERGERFPTLKTLFKICKYYKIDLLTFLSNLNKTTD